MKPTLFHRQRGGAVEAFLQDHKGNESLEPEQGIRRVILDPNEMKWELPEAAMRRLDAFAQVVGIGRRHQGRRIPSSNTLQILGELLDHLLPDGTTAHLERAGQTLDPTKRDYLAHLIYSARAELDKKLREAPSTLLGLPPDTRAFWSNALSSNWIPFQPNWIASLRK